MNEDDSELKLIDDIVYIRCGKCEKLYDIVLDMYHEYYCKGNDQE